MNTAHIFQNKDLNTTLKTLATIKNILMIMKKDGFNRLIKGNVVEVKYSFKNKKFYISKKKQFIKI